MDIKMFMKRENEKPLDNIVSNGGFCSIFRTIACIGDSLSSGEFESFENGVIGYHDFYEYSWGQFLARDVGCNVFNFSRGGMTAKHYDDFAREKEYYNDEYKSQAYIIALGVNDVTQIIKGEIEFGSIDDIDIKDYAKNKPTFAGYYAKIISKYLQKQPKAKFFLMTLPTGLEDGERKELYDKHRELLYKISDLFENCYVLDLRQYAPVYDEEFRKNFFMGHMNPAGYRLTALMIESYIDYIIRNSPEDFAQVGFIGTVYHNSEAKW